MELYSLSTGHDNGSPTGPGGSFSDTGRWQSSQSSQPNTSDARMLERDISFRSPDVSPRIPEDIKPSSSKLTRKTSERRIPRPRNAFMIFRSAFWKEQKINPTVERDHRHISRIIGHYWNRMSEQERDKWRAKAQQEKDEHTKNYPGYVFSPTPRTKKPVRRKVRRNGPEDIKRCETVADLLLMGKQGEDLAEAIRAITVSRTFEGEVLPTSPISNASSSSTGYWSGSDCSGSDFEDPPFRSPLLPPSSLDSTPIATLSFLSPETSPVVETSGAQSLPCSQPVAPESTCPDPQPRHIIAASQPFTSQLFKSALLQNTAPSPQGYELESLNQYFTHNANSFDTLDSVGYATARSPTTHPGFYSASAESPLCDPATVPPLPAAGSSYGLTMHTPRSPSPEPDYYTASTRLPAVDATMVESLPLAETPARVIAEPVHFKDPFPSAIPRVF